MKTPDFSDPPIEPPQEPTIPRLPLQAMLRLGLFQMGLGMMSVLTLGVLNRVMISELQVPATLAAGAIAVHQFMSPTRVWFGQMSDAKTILGYHRTGYVWLGSILFTLTAFAAVQVTWALGNSVAAMGWGWQTYLWVGILGAVFALYGLALSASSTPYTAMLVDISDEENRSRLVSIVWSMLMVGIIIGAIVGAKLFKQVELDAPIAQVQAAVNQVFTIVPAIVFGLAIAATVGIENKYSQYKTRSTLSDREDNITLGAAWRILTASRQTGIFFSFLLVMSISLFMQDAVMEAYGADVFQMPLKQTTQLNAFFGMGTLLGIGATGFLVIPRFGKKNTVKYGCIATAICLLFLIAAGFTGNPKALMYGLLLFGGSSGILTAGAISLMLDLTAAETAGTFIGAWGLAQAMARGLATVLGGIVLDWGKALFSELTLAYGLVFAVQAVGMITAIRLLQQVNIKEFQDTAKQAIAVVMQGDLD
jgi:MFS transporter, BCD family, chlorophyll transporter